MDTPRIAVIMGTTRPARVADKPAQWFMDVAGQRSDLEFELLDLRDYPLPFFEDDYPPAYGPSKSEVAETWKKKLAGFDGFVFVTGEYNNGAPAVLKNALDHAYTEFNKKPVAFFGYGSVGGVRSVQHLRHVAIELQMAPIRQSIHLAGADFFALMQGQKEVKDFAYLNDLATDLLEHLAWWTTALKQARERT